MLCHGHPALPTKFEHILSGFVWFKHSFQQVQDCKHTIVLSSLSDVPPRVTHTLSTGVFSILETWQETVSAWHLTERCYPCQQRDGHRRGVSLGQEGHWVATIDLDTP